MVYAIDFSKKFDIKFVYELNWFRRSQIGFHNRRDLCVLYYIKVDCICRAQELYRYSFQNWFDYFGVNYCTYVTPMGVMYLLQYVVLCISQFLHKFGFF